MNYSRTHLAERACRALLAVVLLVSLGLVARASQLESTKDFADAAAAVDRYIENYGAEHVLLALDIDNTIMSMDGDLGSDHWFEWQNYLLNNEPNSPHLVSKTFSGLLKVQGILYERNHMHPTQPDEPELIGKLQKKGISAILVTSRGPEFRGPTERELKRCSYNFAPTALPVRDNPDGTYLAFDPKSPEKSGLTRSEITKYKLTSPRPVEYVNGIFMTAGQHKGMMLLTLLKKSTRDIKAIVYVDDNVHHVGSVFSAAVARSIDVASFHYEHEDNVVKHFEYGDKKPLDDAWAAVNGAAAQITAPGPAATQIASQTSDPAATTTAPAGQADHPATVQISPQPCQCRHRICIGRR